MSVSGRGAPTARGADIQRRSCCRLSQRSPPPAGVFTVPENQCASQAGVKQLLRCVTVADIRVLRSGASDSEDRISRWCDGMRTRRAVGSSHWQSRPRLARRVASAGRPCVLRRMASASSARVLFSAESGAVYGEWPRSNSGAHISEMMGTAAMNNANMKCTAPHPTCTSF